MAGVEETAAVLEILWSIGLRRSELANLLLVDVDMGRGGLVVRQGKRRKDRVVPVGMWVLALLARDNAVEKWLQEQVVPAWNALQRGETDSLSGNDIIYALKRKINEMHILRMLHTSRILSAKYPP
nr:tyrosine-type recombinase/integrase [Brenneria izbisi]